MKIDMASDTAYFFGHNMKLDTAPSGHWTLTLGEFKPPKDNQTPIPTFIAQDPEEAKMEAEILHLHRTYGHPSRVVLETMIKNSHNHVPNAQ